jgi:hypothetical protein
MDHRSVVKPSLIVIALIAGGAALLGREPMVANADSSGCSLVVDRTGGASAPPRYETIQEAVDDAWPGHVICVRSTDHGDERVHVTSSGSVEAPIRIRAEPGAVVSTQGFIVEADHVVIEGFEVRNAGVGRDRGRGYGIYLHGVGLAAIGNLVIDSDYHGIGCEISIRGCVDVTIARNVIRGANGSGILVAGRDILVESNEVSGSIKRNSHGDADGIRFFGSDLTLRHNYVHDISDSGYPEGEEPHTDCFQTFDNDKPSTSDVLIEGNVCANVDHQCLIATAETKRRSTRIAFENNVCLVGGGQAVLVREVTHVSIRGNLFTDPIAYRAIMLMNGATDATLRANAYKGAFRPMRSTPRRGPDSRPIPRSSP